MVLIKEFELYKVIFIFFYSLLNIKILYYIFKNKTICVIS